jgi:hypothetical protein
LKISIKLKEGSTAIASNLFIIEPHQYMDFMDRTWYYTIWALFIWGGEMKRKNIAVVLISLLFLLILTYILSTECNWGILY